jgi:hypothetical protein
MVTLNIMPLGIKTFGKTWQIIMVLSIATFNIMALSRMPHTQY